MSGLGVIQGVFLLVGLAGFARWLDDELVIDLCTLGLVIEFGLGLVGFNSVAQSGVAQYLCLGSLNPDVPGLGPEIVFVFDELSGAFGSILCVALLACLSFLADYFEYDSGVASIALLSSGFSVAALALFSSFDLFFFAMAWEVIGMISFLLVQHWAFRLASYRAGLKVFAVSQAGDLPIFVFIFWVSSFFGTTGLLGLGPRLGELSFAYISIGGFLVNSATAMGLAISFALILKGAQVIFYPWLLDAMEAPVPISAQLHSSTLVIVGFYPVFRFFDLFALNTTLQTWLVFSGVLTSIGGAVLGFFQEDGKRLLACSTASQLGYVVLGLGCLRLEESFFLLMFCCLNKALTFVWLGLLMSRLGGLSDLRLIGGSCYHLWVEHAGLALSIAGSSVFPGFFVWNTKALWAQGMASGGLFWPAGIGLNLAMASWALSTLYLGYLYIALFVKPRLSRGPGSLRPSPSLGPRPYSTALIGPLNPSSVSSSLFLALLVLALAVGGGSWWFIVWGVDPISHAAGTGTGTLFWARAF